MPEWFDKTKKRWGIESNTRVIAIMVVFSLAGISITQIRPIVWKLLNFTPETATWIKTVAYIAFVFPMYQLFLMIYGTLLGQFRFFWEKEKAMGRWLVKRLGFQPRSPVTPNQESD